jgi:glycine betaine/proline transport system substrate-binding protein
MKRVLISTVLAFALIGGAAKADDEACQKVRFADVGWTDIQVTTGVAQVLLEALGYEPEVNTLAVPVTYASLKSKDIDVFLGNWMPSMTADVTPYLEDKSVESIGVNLDDAGYGLVVPQYVAEAGNDGNRIISTMIAKPENKLDGWELVESSEAGMLTQAEKAMKNNDWIVFLGWTPHPVMGEMKIAYLDGMGDSGFGAAKVYTNVRAGLLQQCPNLGQLLKNLKFNLAMEGAMMAPVLKDGADPKATALAWLKANPDAVKPWLEGVKTFDGNDGLAAVQAALK